MRATRVKLFVEGLSVFIRTRKNHPACPPSPSAFSRHGKAPQLNLGLSHAAVKEGRIMQAG